MHEWNISPTYLHRGVISPGQRCPDKSSTPDPPPKYDRLRSGWGWSVLVRTTSHDGGRAVGPAVRFGGLRRCSPRQSEELLGPRIPPLVGHADGGEPQRGVAELLGTTGDRHNVRRGGPAARDRKPEAEPHGAHDASSRRPPKSISSSRSSSI